jgi:hypothetical protein
MISRGARGLAAWLGLPFRQAVTYRQAWLGATAMVLPIFALAYGLSAAGTALLRLPHLSLSDLVACSVFGCLASALGSSRRIRRQRRIAAAAATRR